MKKAACPNTMAPLQQKTIYLIIDNLNNGQQRTQGTNLGPVPQFRVTLRSFLVRLAQVLLQLISIQLLYWLSAVGFAS